MGSIWAVARQTLSQCLRMKVAVLFIVLLALALVLIPSSLEGDGTLAGRIQTFLAYGTSMVAATLGVVTVLLAVRVVTSDVYDKQIFTVASKPLARWQYMVGRWLGVVLLDVLLLVVAGAAVYGIAQYLRGRPAVSDSDRRKVETEVFTARERISPQPPAEVEARVSARLADMKKGNEYNAALQDFRNRAEGDPDKGYQLLVEEIRKQVMQQTQSVAPGREMEWAFANIQAAGKETDGEGEVVAVRRTPKPADGEGQASMMLMVQVAPSLTGHVIWSGPVVINGVEARVTGLASDGFVAQFDESRMKEGNVSGLDKGQKVRLTFMPTIQIAYKASPASAVPGNILRGYWEIENPDSGYKWGGPVEMPVNMVATLTVPAKAVDSSGRVRVKYTNQFFSDGTGTSVSILNEDIAVLYKVGSFGTNYVRGMGLVLLEMLFLAAMGVLTGSFLSFSVACLANVAMFPFYFIRAFLADAVKVTPGPEGSDALTWLGHYVLVFMSSLLPDIAGMWPSGRLVDGLNTPWSFLGEMAVWTGGVQCAVVLGLACLIFQKRELARVQV